TGLRFAVDHLRTSQPIEPAWHSFPDPAPPHPAAAGPHLEPAGVGVAPHHLVGTDAHLPHAARPGRAHRAARLWRPTAANPGHRPGPRGTDYLADQQPPRQLCDAGDPLRPAHADRE